MEHPFLTEQLRTTTSESSLKYSSFDFSRFNKLEEVLCNTLYYSFISNLFHRIENIDSARGVLVELIEFPNALSLNFFFQVNFLIQKKMRRIYLNIIHYFIDLKKCPHVKLVLTIKWCFECIFYGCIVLDASLI